MSFGSFWSFLGFFYPASCSVGFGSWNFSFTPFFPHPFILSVVTVASWRSRTSFKNRPLCGIHACFRNPLVLFLKHFLVERWRDLVLENTDIVFT